jgi:hypothetical protein
MPKRDPARLTRVSVNLPFQIGSFEWEADVTERRAAWSLYVELVTRIAIVPLDPDHGVLREALSSLYSLYPTTRAVLKEAGPDVGGGLDSVGGIAIAVLNRGLRPFMAKWHPRLLAYEEQRPEGMTVLEHERRWVEAPTMRAELEVLQRDLRQYADALAAIAGADPVPDFSNVQ